MRAANNSSDSTSTDAALSIPWHTVWDRQRGATGLQYPDPSLQGVAVQNVGIASWTPARGPDHSGRHDPQIQKFYHAGKFDFQQLRDMKPEEKILADRDFHPVPNVGFWSWLYGSPHPGWYLTFKK